MATLILRMPSPRTLARALVWAVMAAVLLYGTQPGLAIGDVEETLRGVRTLQGCGDTELWGGVEADSSTPETPLRVLRPAQRPLHTVGNSDDEFRLRFASSRLQSRGPPRA